MWVKGEAKESVRGKEREQEQEKDMGLEKGRELRK